MKNRTTIVLVAVAFGLAVGWLAGRSTPAHAPAESGAAHSPQAEPGTHEVWTCSMHPQIRQDHPGSCPICGMDLIPAGTAGDDSPAVFLSESARRIASIEIQPVERRVLDHELAAVGRIELAEPLIANLTARTRARVERVWADFTGTTVAAGDHLVDLYSPELVVAQQELLSAPSPEFAALARRKLALWGMTTAQVDALAAEGAVRTVVTLHAPIGGIVIEKSAVEGRYVEEGDLLYTIADLSTVWLKADIYEIDLPWVAIGQPAEVQVEGLPGQVFAGTVAFVDPLVNEATRTVRVRVNLPNPGGQLRPGMFAHAMLRSRLGPDGLHATSPLAGRWVCPMHPDINSDAPGTCSVCGMDLRRVEPAPGEVASGPPGGIADAPLLASRWVCPMHPEISSDAAGACSVCGMDLRRVEPAASEAAGGDSGESADAPLLAVPVTAVLDTGQRRIVYVEEQAGHYVAREVVLGPRARDVYPVLSGLVEGERVVVHGAFLVDSQSQIEGRPSLLLPEGLERGASAPPGHAEHGGR